MQPGNNHVFPVTFRFEVISSRILYFWRAHKMTTISYVKSTNLLPFNMILHKIFCKRTLLIFQISTNEGDEAQNFSVMLNTCQIYTNYSFTHKNLCLEFQSLL